MRSPNRFETSTRLTSPITNSFAAVSNLLVDAFEGLGANVGADDLDDVAGLLDLAERQHLILHPGEVLDRDRQIRLHDAVVDGIVENKSRARVVGLGIG